MAKSTITIVGLGLVGGSLGLALQKVKPDFEIVGHDKEREVANRAKKLGAVDRTEWNLISACEGASIVILATPVQAVRDTMVAIGPHLKPGAVVTDTATTKQHVLRWAEELLPANVGFVGGDPLIRASQPGLDGASADLFVDARYCLIPLPSAQPDSIQLVVDLVTLVGARPYFIDAAEHDGLMAGTAHLPFVLSAALLNTVSSSGAWPELIKMAGYDFRQATATADTDPEAHCEICLANIAGMLRWIDAAAENLAALRRAVAAEDGEQIVHLFRKAHTARDELLQGRQQDKQLADELDRLDRNRIRQMFLGSAGRKP